MPERANRLLYTFANLAAEGRAALAPFITGGDPDLYAFKRILMALPEAGADIVEVGLPAREPAMDGPVIAKAHERARTAGVTTASVLSVIKEFRTAHPDIPVIVMGYRESLEQGGIAGFVEQVAAAGADGILIVDLDEAEWAELDATTTEARLAAIRVVTPETSKKWMHEHLPPARGFVYTVAASGPTGSEPLSDKKLAKRVARVRELARLPVALGFGIREATQVRAYGRIADALFVGTVLAETVETNMLGDPAAAVADQVRELAGGLRPKGD